ncbi:hypothetical protein AB0N14_28865 [Streptomyces sp. NPDC051104]
MLEEGQYGVAQEVDRGLVAGDDERLTAELEKRSWMFQAENRV